MIEADIIFLCQYTNPMITIPTFTTILTTLPSLMPTFLANIVASLADLFDADSRL